MDWNANIYSPDVELWTQVLDEGYGIDTIYLDYCKAFDSVPFKRLLKNVEGFDTGENAYIYSWIPYW